MRVVSGLSVRWSARLLLRLLFLLLLAIPATSAGSVSAAEPSLAGEWEITLEVRASQVRVLWIGRVWDLSQGEGEIIAQRRVDISDDCQDFGGVQIGKSDVIFDGVDDYLQCTVPDFQLIFVDMVPELGHCYCDFASPPYAAADISPIPSQSAQPVVYHDRLYFDVMLAETKNLYIPFLNAEINVKGNAEVDAAGNDINVQGGEMRADVVDASTNIDLGIARISLRFYGDDVVQTRTWQSNFFDPLQENGLQLWAGFDVMHYLSFTSEDGWAKFLAESGFWDAVESEDASGFLMWESEALAKFSDEEMPEGFVLGPGTPIYFGYNPDTDTYFEGTMRAVAIDPGCRAH